MNNVKRIALATALILAMPAMAQTFLQPLPKGAKYRDQGTKPTTGRSGLAAIEARALLGRDGMTDIEVTTGHFEGIGGGGTLAKVQVKLFSGGALMVGTIARTDLLGHEHAPGLAKDAHATLHRRLFRLPEATRVLPTHGGGSFCGNCRMYCVASRRSV